MCSKNQNTIISGGTEPVCIFSNTDCTNMFNGAQTIIFTTDGYITDQQVKQFGNIAQISDQSILIICVLVCDTNINISVIASLMVCPDILVIHSHTKTGKVRVIQATGQLADIYKVDTEFDPKPLMNARFRLAENIPETVDLNSERLVNSNYMTVINNDPAILNQFTFVEIIKMASISLINGSIRTLYTSIKKWVNQWKQTSDAIVISTLKKSYRKCLQKTIYYSIKNIDEHNQSVMSLRQTRNKYREEYKSNPRQRILKYIEDLFDVNHYNSHIFFGSNKAKIELGGQFKSMCSICLEEGDITFSLNTQIRDDNGNTLRSILESKSCIDFPLTYQEFLSKMIVPNPVCAECMKEYIVYTRQTIYHQPFDSYITVSRINGYDNNYLLNQLCEKLINGKIMCHLPLVWLATLMNESCNWIPRRDEIIDNLTTYLTTTFNHDNNIVPLPMAAQNVIHTDYLNNHPPSSAYRILKIASTARTDSGTIIEIAKTVYKYSLVTAYETLRDNDQNLQKTRDTILSLIYPTSFGIVNLSDPLLLTWNHPRMIKFVGSENLYGFETDYQVDPEDIADWLYNLATFNKINKDWQDTTGVIIYWQYAWLLNNYGQSRVP
jgi:hypothetical protein